MARFDWYQGSVVAPPNDLLERLGESFPGHWEDMPRAPYGYDVARRLVDQDGPVCQVWWGKKYELPHVVFSGETAEQGAEVLRTWWPHRVSRADVCIDYAEPGAYDRLQDLALGIARDQGIKVGTAGDHLLTKEGRTLYLGAPSSHTRLRIYDKAAELRQHYANQPAKLDAVPAELARLEVQVRPATPQAKVSASGAPPLVLMGSAAWTRELMRRVAGVELEPFQAGRPWRQADDDRAYAALLAQYGGLLQRVFEDIGSWDLVGRQIGDDLAVNRRMSMRKGVQ